MDLLRLKQAFAAFGVDPETHTDKLIGAKVQVVVSERSDEWIDRILPLEVTEASS